jgi:hypothetical protein
MVAEPGPDMRIRALTSGSAVRVDGGGAALTRPRSTVWRGCGRLPAGICAKYAPKLMAVGCRDAAEAAVWGAGLNHGSGGREVESRALTEN